MSVESIPLNWFDSLDPQKVSSWDDITKAFLAQYSCNTEFQVTLRELEVLKQKENEGFTTFYSRWRERAAQMIQRPSDTELVQKFVDNLSGPYKQHLQYLGLDTFKRVYDVGIKIENDLLKLKELKSRDNEESINNPSPLGNDINTVEARPYKAWVRGRTFTPIGMTYTQALEKLYDKKQLFPVGPTPNPPEDKRSSNFNLNAYCKYHRGCGHDTERCWVLKHIIQDMIEEGKLNLPI